MGSGHASSVSSCLSTARAGAFVRKPVTERKEQTKMRLTPALTRPATALAALLLASVMAVPLSAAAQTAAPASPQAGTAEFTEDQLKSFAAATLEVEELHQKYSPQIAAAKEPSEQEAIRGQALEEMTEAVRGEGLSIEEYNGIVSQLYADPEMAKTVEAYRSEMQ
jgi:hypothetical protein